MTPQYFWFWLKYDPDMPPDSGGGRAQVQLGNAGDNSTTGGTIRNNDGSDDAAIFGGTIRNRAVGKLPDLTLTFAVTGLALDRSRKGGFTFYGESPTEARMWGKRELAEDFARRDDGGAFSTWLGGHHALLTYLEIK